MLEINESKEPLSDEELFKLAKDIFNNEVFTSSHVVDSFISSVFIPLQSLDDNQIEELKTSKMTFVYEYINKAEGTSKEGLPIFCTVQFLHRDEQDKMESFYEKIRSSS